MLDNDQQKFYLVYDKYDFILSDIGLLYFANDEVSMCETYWKKGVDEYNSIICGNNLLPMYLYGDKESIEMATRVQKMIVDSTISKNDSNHLNFLSIKYHSFELMFNYFYDKGDYLSAKEYAVKLVEFKKNNNMNYMQFNNNRVVTNKPEEYIEKCNNHLNSVPIVSNDIINKYFKPEYVELMDENIKIFIQTALQMYDTINEIVSIRKYTFDYSPSIITLFKAIENLIFTITNKYLDYLKKMNLKSLKGINKKLKGKDGRLVETIQKFDLGTGFFSMFNGYGSFKFRDTFYSFLETNHIILNNNEVSNFSKNFFDLCNIRNNTAHRFRVDIDEANKCRGILFDEVNFIESIYKYFINILK